MPVSGGQPRPIAEDVTGAADVVWSPDGRALLVYGVGQKDNRGRDWFFVPLDGSPSVRTHAYDRIAAAGIGTDLNSGLADVPWPMAWSRSGVVFHNSPVSQNASLWLLPIDSTNGTVREAPRQLTSDVADDEAGAVSVNGQLVFAALTQRNVIVGVPLEANVGRQLGPPRPLREDRANTGRADVSRDGRYLAFPLYSFNGAEVRWRDLRTGSERQLAITPSADLDPTISPDGSQVAWTAQDTAADAAQRATGYAVAASGGVPRVFCRGCTVHGWSSDNRHVVVQTGGGVSLIDMQTGAQQVVLARGGTRPFLSPNERWIAFSARSHVYVAAVRPGNPPPDSEWIDVDGSGGRACGWSPDGRLLYLLLEIDGFRCLYAIRIDPDSGRPQGEPFPVTHFHNSNLQWGSTGYGNAIATGLFVSDMAEYTGNIWMMRIAPQ